jgi:hypothetical protein
VEAQAAALAKKNGFASLAQYDDVLTNIIMIMSGIEPQTKKFIEPPEQIKNEIAALKADQSVPEMQKKEGLAQLEPPPHAAPLSGSESERAEAITSGAELVVRHSKFGDKCLSLGQTPS